MSTRYMSTGGTRVQEYMITITVHITGAGFKS